MTDFEPQLRTIMDRIAASQRILCPKCGSVVYDANANDNEDHPVSYWGEAHEVSCSTCETDFTVHETVTRSWTYDDDTNAGDGR